MADVMTAPSVGGRLAVVEGLGRRWEFGIDPKVMQQAVRIKGEKIVEGLIAHPEQVRVQDPHIFEREREGGSGGKRGRALRFRAPQIQGGKRRGGALCVGHKHPEGCRSNRGQRGATIKDAAEEVPSDHGKLALTVAPEPRLASFFYPRPSEGGSPKQSEKAAPIKTLTSVKVKTAFVQPSICKRLISPCQFPQVGLLLAAAERKPDKREACAKFTFARSAIFFAGH